jgi:large repetitive protein
MDSLDNTASGTFSIVVTNNLRFTTAATLITTYVNVNYSTAIKAKGGTGSGYVFTVKAGSTLPDGLALSSGGVLTGKPTTAGTFGFEVTVTDTASNTATQTFLIPA